MNIILNAHNYKNTFLGKEEVGTICGSHGSEHKDSCLLGHDAMASEAKALHGL
jgi:hypothetical protein